MKRHGSRKSRVGDIKAEDSESGVKMMKGLLVVELFSKGCFVDVVVACGPGSWIEEEDYRIFWISSVVSIGHDSWWLVESVARLTWETASFAKRPWRNPEAVSLKDVVMAP
jgi:hypothetical protein